MNLYDVFSAGFSDDPTAPLMSCPSGRTVTYGAMDGLSAAIAARLADHGARPGDRLMMQVEKTPEAIALYLACLRAGVIFIPLNPAYGRDELAYLAADATPCVVVCDGNSAFAAKDFPFVAPCTVLTLDKDGKGTLTDALPQGRSASVSCAGDDIAAILYTSGTTGKPKGAMLTHDNLRSNAAALCACWGLSRDDVLLHALPIFHTHGLFVAINTTLLGGSRMIFLPRFDADQVFNTLPDATVMMGVPTFYTRLLDDARLTGEACAHMRLFVSGSAPLLADTFEAFQSRTGHTILERYGMTETNMIASNPLKGARRAGTVGQPLPGVLLRVTAADGTEVAQGETGGIEVIGPNVFKGYWQNPEKTRSEFRPDGWFITGDLGQIDADGYLRIVGRAKDLIISGGFNVYPKEVEEVIDALDGVTESAIIGLPHKDFGEGVAAVVVCHDPALTADAIKARCRAHLAVFKTPKAVILVGALPRNAMGKVEKAKLRAMYHAFFST